MCRIERWSTRELSKKIDDMLFERTAIAKKSDNVIEKEISKLRETQILEPDLIIQDPYIFSYLSTDVLGDEKTLEDAILNDIEEFLLSMGKGWFCRKFFPKRKEQLFWTSLCRESVELFKNSLFFRFDMLSFS